MRAHPPQHAGQGQALQDQLHGLPVFALTDKLHVALDVDAGRAGGGAGRAVLFINGKGDGNGLGKRPVNGFAVGQALVPLTGQG
jgi:hypothetical protein